MHNYIITIKYDRCVSFCIALATKEEEKPDCLVLQLCNTLAAAFS